jgi:hypothetical protein
LFLLENKALITVGETISNVAMRYTTIDEGESRQEVDFVPLDRMFCVSSVDMNIECSRLLQEARSSELLSLVVVFLVSQASRLQPVA